MRKRKFTHEETKNAVWELPYAERTTLLTLSVLERNQDEPVAAVIGLVELVSRLSQYFSEEKRFRLADRLRNAADLAEKNVLIDQKD
jgi:hypothetical protein